MDMLTTSQAAAVLQISDQTIRRYIDDGKLRGERLPEEKSWYRIRRDDLQEFAEKYDLTLDWSRLSQ